MTKVEELKRADAINNARVAELDEIPFFQTKLAVRDFVAQDREMANALNLMAALFRKESWLRTNLWMKDQGLIQKFRNNETDRVIKLSNYYTDAVKSFRDILVNSFVRHDKFVSLDRNLALRQLQIKSWPLEIEFTTEAFAKTFQDDFKALGLTLFVLKKSNRPNGFQIVEKDSELKGLDLFFQVRRWSYSEKDSFVSLLGGLYNLRDLREELDKVFFFLIDKKFVKDTTVVNAQEDFITTV